MLWRWFIVKLGQIRNLAKLSKDLRAKFGEFGESAPQYEFFMARSP